MPEKRFPIQGECVRPPDGVGGRAPRREAGWVPWAIAEEAYKVYSKRYGKDQPLERLAQRGGFSWSELVELLRGGDEFPMIPWAGDDPDRPKGA